MLNMISMEAIDYQVNDKFIGDLTTVLEQMESDIVTRKYITSPDAIDAYSKQIEKLIKNRFNLTILCAKELYFISPMAIMPFSTDMINALSPINSNTIVKPFGFNAREYDTALRKVEQMVQGAREDARSINNKKGSIDLKRAIVSGYLADVRHHLIMDPVYLFDKVKLTPREMAEIISHEIGHAFIGLEYHYRMVTSNENIASVMKQIQNNEPKKINYIFRSTFGPNDLVAASLSDDSTREDFYGALAAKYIDVTESRYGSKGYDATTFESLADNFVVRMGGGAGMVTALDKLNSVYSYSTHRHVWRYRIRVWLNYTIWYIICSVIGGPFVAGVYATVIDLLYILTSFVTAYTDEIYDNHSDRNVRIGNALVNILKDKSLPVGERKTLLNQIELVDVTNRDQSNYTPLGTSLIRFLAPSLRKKSYYKRMEQKVEASLNNPLFVSSAKLDTL